MELRPAKEVFTKFEVLSPGAELAGVELVESTGADLIVSAGSELSPGRVGPLHVFAATTSKIVNPTRIIQRALDLGGFCFNKGFIFVVEPSSSLFGACIVEFLTVYKILPAQPGVFGLASNSL